MVKFRGSIERFSQAGWRLSVVDLERMLSLADPGPVELAVSPLLTPAGSSTRMSMNTTDALVHLEAIIHTRQSEPIFKALDNGPLGTLLQRRVEAGDERAVRVVAGLQAAADQLNRLASGRPAWPPPAGRVVSTEQFVDAQTGLKTTVSTSAVSPRGTRTVWLRASRPSLAAADLAAFFGAVVQVVHRLWRADVRGDFTMMAAYSGPDRVSLDQVGGLDDVVAQFRNIAVSFRNPSVMARWGAKRPQGILLWGPPGTGKTMLARALAQEIGGTLREIRTPEILDKWLGASERNLKRIFAQARQYRSPTVLLFDEFDSIIGYARGGGDSGSHAINAVAGLFKQEMNQLIDENPSVIVVATTNFVDAIDASLIRSGRFDIKLEIPRPDLEARVDIVKRMMRDLVANLERDGFTLFADDIDLNELARHTDGLVGADLREVLRRAQLAKAMREAHTGHGAKPIRQSDLLNVIREFRPD